ncbi:MAG: hypothetical protein DMF50_08060 [Acidobacteria bacterium]|nr:MAG: hypothetical protein DMF50_08060 [Acidobacteriota bacterium]
MPRSGTWLLPAALLCAALGGPPSRAADLTPQRQVEGRLMCYCGCADLTVRLCTCGTADGIRGEITRRLATGETPDQVVAAFVAQYGEQIRSAPSTSGFDLVAWVTPFAVLVAAGSALLFTLRRWEARGARPAPSAAGQAAARQVDAAPLTEAEREVMRRVEREIKEGL